MFKSEAMRGVEQGGEVRGRRGEGELLLRHADGDPKAFGELIALYRRPVYGYLIRCGIAPRYRDDLFQEIFLKVHAAAAGFQPERPLKAWLFTVVANTVRSHFRKRAVFRRFFKGNETETAADAAPDAFASASARESARCIDEALARLPIAQKQVLLLSTLADMEQKDIAQVLGLPLNTVKSHLRRSRLALARMLAKHHTRGNKEVIQ